MVFRAEAEVKRLAPFSKPLVGIDFGKSIGKFYELKGSPEKIVRVMEFGGVLDQDLSMYAKAKEYFGELRQKYGIHVPEMQTVVVVRSRVSEREGHLFYYSGLFYTVVDRIYGATLREISKASQFPNDKFDECFASLVLMFTDVEKNGGAFVGDFVNPWEMFMYGRRVGEEEDNVYLVDVDPELGMHDEKDELSQLGLLHVVENFYDRTFKGRSHFPLTHTNMLKFLQEIEPKTDRSREVVRHLLQICAR